MKRLISNLLVIYFALFIVKVNTGILENIVDKSYIEKSNSEESGEESEKKDKEIEEEKEFLNFNQYDFISNSTIKISTSLFSHFIFTLSERASIIPTPPPDFIV